MPSRGDHLLFPTLVCLPAILAALVGVWPRLTPAWVARPNRVGPALGLFFLAGIMMIPLVMLAFSAVIAWNIEEPFSRGLAMLAAASLALPALVVQWLGLVLGCWPDDDAPRAAVPPATPRVPAASTEDLRALRLSRMGG
ncbi:hypothetical protein K1T73_08870 [Roseovarius sp. SCSIO 43702]|uniref:hypothetical protein n=1 Tax=Roseovarius sp. SCSIO 43702 TaxID=2823043 RepID=UPI001C730885|nr:hypothetical protein [Roseovarius sp. SCSIO 43702]QYX58442.1 hypothetical protein K1T73_08870 [Roseovarius sp. SCSIO 43702]